MTGKPCPCCGTTAELTRYDLCQPCTAANGFDPHCETCHVDMRGQQVPPGMEHEATCWPGQRASDTMTTRTEENRPVSTDLTPHARAELDFLARVEGPRKAEAVLIAHQRRDIRSCLCGWSELGKFHAGHQVRMLAEAGVLADGQGSRESAA